MWMSTKKKNDEDAPDELTPDKKKMIYKWIFYTCVQTTLNDAHGKKTLLNGTWHIYVSLRSAIKAK